MYRPTFRRFALVTAGLTGGLIMLGILTAATGSGLACSQQWPLCDGGVLPNSLPSFFEWFHRLVAMVTGFFILGTALWSWVAPVGRRTQVATTLAAVLLPLQIAIGAVTVTLGGAIPGGYSVPTQAAHLLVALVIFSGLVLAAVFAHEGHLGSIPTFRARQALVVALVFLPLNAVFGRATPFLDYSPVAQSVFVGTGLVVIAALLATFVWLRDPRTPEASLRPGVALAIAAVLGVLLLGRDLVVYSVVAMIVNWLLYAMAFVLVVAATLFLFRAHGGSAGVWA